MATLAIFAKITPFGYFGDFEWLLWLFSLKKILTTCITTDTFCSRTSVQDWVQFSISFAKTFVLDMNHHSSLIDIVEVTVQPRFHGDSGGVEKRGQTLSVTFGDQTALVGGDRQHSGA